MKENQVEFVFIGIIIVVFATWKLSEMIKSKCYEKNRLGPFKEGFRKNDSKNDKEMPEAAPELMTQLNELLKKNNIDMLSTFSLDKTTENFTVDTSEAEMTIHQRKKAATSLDTFTDNTTKTTTTPTTTPTTASKPPLLLSQHPPLTNQSTQ